MMGKKYDSQMDVTNQRIDRTEKLQKEFNHFLHDEVQKITVPSHKKLTRYKKRRKRA